MSYEQVAVGVSNVGEQPVVAADRQPVLHDKRQAALDEWLESSRRLLEQHSDVVAGAGQVSVPKAVDRTSDWEHYERAGFGD